MIVNLSGFINSPDLEYKFEGKIESNKSRYSIDNYNLVFPIDYKATIFKVQDQLILYLDIKYIIHTYCSRCLVEVDKKMETKLETYLINDCDLEKLELEDSKEYYEIKDLNLDLDDIIISQVITSMPLKILCDENCKGICSTCGQDLNEGLCECEDSSIDPRFEKLLNFLKEDEEV